MSGNFLPRQESSIPVPLPDIQELRRQFVELSSLDQEDTFRAKRALEHAEFLRDSFDVPSGSINSRIFLDSIVVLCNSAMANAYREAILGTPSDFASELRQARIQHTLITIPARKRIKKAIADSLLANPEVPAQKHFHRLSKITESAAAAVFGTSEGRRFIGGIVAEQKVLTGLHQMGYRRARDGTTAQDARDMDIFVPEVTRNQRGVGLQIKADGTPGLYEEAVLGKRYLKIVVGTNPDSPYELTDGQYDGLGATMGKLAA